MICHLGVASGSSLINYTTFILTNFTDVASTSDFINRRLMAAGDPYRVTAILRVVVRGLIVSNLGTV